MIWLDNNSSFFWTQFIAILGFVGVILEIIVHTKEAFGDDPKAAGQHAITAIFFLQFIFILIVIFILNKRSFPGGPHIKRYKIYHDRILKTDLTAEKEEAAKSVSTLNTQIFGHYWLLFWKWIFLLYLLLSARYVLDEKNIHTVYYFIGANVAETFLNNYSMVNLFVCFLLIQEPLGSLRYSEESLNKRLNNFLTNRDLAFLIVKGFSLVHLFVLLAIIFLDGDPGHYIINPDKPDLASDINLFFKTASGVFNCVCLALLIARLDSKIINVPSKLISLLVLYAALQPLYVFFDDKKHNLIVLLVSGFTLGLKVYFYLIVAFVIKTGRLSDLFMTFPLIKYLIEREGYQKPGPKADKDAVPSNQVKEFSRHLKLLSVILEASGFRTKQFYRIAGKKGGDGPAAEGKE